MGRHRALRMKSTTKRLPAALVEHFQYKLMLDAVADHAIYMLDPDGAIVSWNRGAERLKGYKSTEILGRNFEIFYTPEDRAAETPKRALQTAATAGRFASEGWRLRSDGTRFWASVVIDPIHDHGTLLGFAKVTRDVSRHRDSELALQKALERLTLAADSGAIGIWDWDLKHDRMSGDDWMRRLYGTDAETDITSYDMWRTFLHPDDRAAIERATLEAIRGIKPYNTEFRIVWRDGSVHDIHATGRVAYDETGEPVEMVGTNRDITARKTAERALEQALARLTLAADSGQIGIWDWDIKNDILLWDDWMFRLYSTEPQDPAEGFAMWERHLHPDDRAAANLAVADCLAGIRPLNIEFRIIWQDGSVHDMRGTGRLTRDANGHPAHLIGTNRDITQFKQALKARDEIQNQVENILDNMNGYLFQRAMTPDGKIYYPYISKSFNRIIGRPHETGPPTPDLFHLVSPLDAERAEAAIRQSARDFTDITLELRLLTDDNREIWVNTHSTIRRQYDGTIIWDGFGTDITSEKRAARQLFYLTYHDRLTGLGNRAGFEADLEDAVTSAIETFSPFFVFFVDIADFRAMNDTLGVRQGDLIIRRTAGRLQAIAGDDAVVARIAGDEFAVLKSGIEKPEATALAGQLCAGLAEPIQLDEPGGEPIDPDDTAAGVARIDVNIGISGFPDADSQNAAALYQDPVPECMKRCDIALYEAKRLGRGRFCHYSDDIDHRIRNRTLLQQSLHQALEQNEFILHYQPIFDFQSGDIIGAEALVRWQHPKLGFQPPDQFIPLAEESGLIVPLGAWVLKSSMIQIREWRASLGLKKIAVNVSGVQFSQTNFVEMIGGLLRETGASPDMIELELTETTLIDCSPEMLQRMNALRTIGFTLAIDDFGAGYSSLKYLTKLPVDKLKIDQWFVSQMLNDSSDAAIIRTIVALGKGLNLKVVAEGVETASQRDFLLAEGCSSGQGYLFSKPLPPNDFEQILKNRQ